MKKILFILIAVLACAAPASAQRQAGQQLSEQDREKWLSEMRAYKHEFLIKELSLTRDQQNRFFPIYDQMDEQVNRIVSETRDLESKVSANASASDTELESASRALFEQKSREGAVELEYYSKFKEILSPRQLLRLKNAERKFTQQLVRQHGRIKNNGQARKQ